MQTMTDEQRYTELLKTIAETLHNQSNTIYVRRIQIETLERALEAAEKENAKLKGETA